MQKLIGRAVINLRKLKDETMMMKSMMMLAILGALNPASPVYSATASVPVAVPAFQPASTGQQNVSPGAVTLRSTIEHITPRAASVIFGTYGPWPTDIVSPANWDSGTAATGEQLIRNSLLSPNSFSVSSPATFYSQQTRLIAHRGLVDLYNGIPENSLEAIKNAFNHGVNLVEIDVQATSDGIAVPLHDDSLSRPLNIPQNAADVAFSAIDGEPLLIKNPLFNLVDGGTPYYTTGSKLLSLADELNQALSANPNATFFVDPKNLNAAMAVARVAMNDQNLAAHMIMKTYTAYWGASGPSAVISQATNSGQARALQSMQVMPVDNETAAAGGMGSAAAAQDVINDVGNWSNYFRVPSVELPGFWDPNWQTLKNNVNAGLTAQVLTSNPRDANNNVYKSVISTGYRFEDFAFSGQPYDWGMDGQPKVDTANATRRTVGAERDSAGWITTDLPLQEAYATLRSFSYSESGNAFVGFPSIPAQNYGSGNNGDQGGP